MDVPDNTTKVCFATNQARGFIVKLPDEEDWIDYKDAHSFKSVIGSEMEEWLTPENDHNIGASSQKLPFLEYYDPQISRDLFNVTDAFEE